MKECNLKLLVECFCLQMPPRVHVRISTHNTEICGVAQGLQYTVKVLNLRRENNFFR